MPSFRCSFPESIQCLNSDFLTFHSRPPVLLALCFHGLTNCCSRKPFALINICVAPRVWGCSNSRFATFSRQNLLTPLSTYCCELFVVAKKLNLFIIKQIQTLAAKHPGWDMPPLHQLKCLRVSAVSFASAPSSYV